MTEFEELSAKSLLSNIIHNRIQTKTVRKENDRDINKDKSIEYYS
jgi:hypothetical protein